LKLKLKMKKSNNRGFTLIEILIVVAIIAILASMVLVGLGPTQRAGRDARRISDLRSIQTGLELAYSKCGYYPGTIASGACSAVDPGDWTALGTTLTGVGVNNLPNDPNTNATLVMPIFPVRGMSSVPHSRIRAMVLSVIMHRRSRVVDRLRNG
jgi:prepilin-type N-terminal cleavage/methylation domain-containing protein